ncbi:MAG: hypothetical protein AB7P69_00340, partial [Candidatus Binatia bacterium]
RWGLLTKVVEPEALATETKKLVARCLQVGWKAATAAKPLLRDAWSMDFETLVEEVDRARAVSIETGELSESMQVYREKRQPKV